MKNEVIVRTNEPTIGDLTVRFTEDQMSSMLEDGLIRLEPDGQTYIFTAKGWEVIKSDDYDGA